MKNKSIPSNGAKKAPKTLIKDEGRLPNKAAKKLCNSFISLEDARTGNFCLTDLMVKSYVEQMARVGRTDYSWASNKHMAEQCGGSHINTISRSVGRLIKQGALSRIQIKIGLRIYRRLYVGGGKDIKIQDPQHVQALLGEIDSKWAYLTVCMVLGIVPAPRQFGTPLWDEAVKGHFDGIHPHHRGKIIDKLKNAFGVDFKLINREEGDNREVIFLDSPRVNLKGAEIVTKGLSFLTERKKMLLIFFKERNTEVTALDIPPQPPADIPGKAVVLPISRPQEALEAPAPKSEAARDLDFKKYIYNNMKASNRSKVSCDFSRYTDYPGNVVVQDVKKKGRVTVVNLTDIFHKSNADRRDDERVESIRNDSQAMSLFRFFGEDVNKSTIRLYDWINERHLLTSAKIEQLMRHGKEDIPFAMKDGFTGFLANRSSVKQFFKEYSDRHYYDEHTRSWC